MCMHRTIEKYMLQCIYILFTKSCSAHISFWDLFACTTTLRRFT